MKPLKARTLRAIALTTLGLLTASLFVMPAARAGGPEILVNTYEDELNEPNKTDDCSLREAIEAANTDTEVDGCTAGTENTDRIDVPPGTYELTLGQLVVTSPTNLFGPEFSPDDPVIVDGGSQIGETGPAGEEQPPQDQCSDVASFGVEPGPGADRIFNIQSTVTIQTFVIRGGFVSEGHTTKGGAGILNSGSLTLVESTVEENFVYLNASEGKGGGISNTGSLHVGGAGYTGSHSTVRNNVVFAYSGTAFGGGISSDTYSGGNSAQGENGLTGFEAMGGRINFNRACGARGAFGGGVHSFGQNDRMEDTTLRGNLVQGQVAEGGGAYIQGTKGDPTLTLFHTDVLENSARGDRNRGGGIFNDSILELDRSTVSGNVTLETGGAGGGAGIWHGGLTYDISQSTIDNNDATASQPAPEGGPQGLQSSQGGGIHVASSSCNSCGFGEPIVWNSTIANNSADQGGGYFAGEGGQHTEILSSTIARNEATEGGGIWADNISSKGTFPTVELRQTIVGENEEGGDCHEASPDAIASSGFNLDSDGSCPLGGTGDKSNQDPQLFDLDYNGSAEPIRQTDTMRLDPDSPAVDAVPPGSQQTQGVPGCPPPEIDQRGVPRPQDGDDNGSKRCDIGAFEVIGGPIEKFCPGFADDNRNQIIGTNKGETLEGTKGPDIICGLGGNDVLRGFDGHDRIMGGDGNDDIFGGKGNDTAFAGQGNDDVNGGVDADNLHGKPGTDTVDGGEGNDFLRGGNGVDVVLGGDDKDFLSGGDEGDTMRGNAGVDRLRGRKGDDKMFGGADNDKLFGGFGFDALNGEAGANDYCVARQDGGTRVNCEQP